MKTKKETETLCECGHNWGEHYHRIPYVKNGKLNAGKCREDDCFCVKFKPQSQSGEKGK